MDAKKDTYKEHYCIDSQIRISDMISEGGMGVSTYYDYNGMEKACNNEEEA